MSDLKPSKNQSKDDSAKREAHILPMHKEGVCPEVLSNRPESEVWDLFRAGDESAFVHIYEQYFDVLFNYAYRFCPYRESVKDHIQELFITLCNTKQRLGKTTSIKFYLFAALRRRIVRALSKENKLKHVSDRLEGYDFEIIVSPEQQLIDLQMNENIKKTLTQNISQLTDRQREAIMYYYYEGFTYEQISKIMDFSQVKYARILVYRALKKLKENLHFSDIFR